MSFINSWKIHLIMIILWISIMQLVSSIEYPGKYSPNLADYHIQSIATSMPRVRQVGLISPGLSFSLTIFSFS